LCFDLPTLSIGLLFFLSLRSFLYSAMHLRFRLLHYFPFGFYPSVYTDKIRSGLFHSDCGPNFAPHSSSLASTRLVYSSPSFFVLSFSLILKRTHISSALYYFIAISSNPLIVLFSMVVILYSALKTTEYTNQLGKKYCVFSCSVCHIFRYEMKSHNREKNWKLS